MFGILDQLFGPTFLCTFITFMGLKPITRERQRDPHCSVMTQERQRINGSANIILLYRFVNNVQLHVR